MVADGEDRHNGTPPVDISGGRGPEFDGALKTSTLTLPDQTNPDPAQGGTLILRHRDIIHMDDATVPAMRNNRNCGVQTIRCIGGEMLTRLKRTVHYFAAAALAAGFAASASAATFSFDLTADYSSANNPNGAWSFTVGGGGITEVPLQSTTFLGFPAWEAKSGAQSSAPIVFKLPVPFQSFGANEVIVKLPDFTDIGQNGPLTNIVFTSPVAGVAAISGSITHGGGALPAGYRLFETHTNALLDAGGIGSGDPPHVFSASGVNLSVNDLVVLLLSPVTLSPPSPFVAIRLHIDIETPDVVQTPIPGALPLFATGLAVLGFLARRKRKAIAAA